MAFNLLRSARPQALRMNPTAKENLERRISQYAEEQAQVRCTAHGKLLAMHAFLMTADLLLVAPVHAEKR